jgi:hypothetical protein
MFGWGVRRRAFTVVLLLLLSSAALAACGSSPSTSSPPPAQSPTPSAQEASYWKDLNFRYWESWNFVGKGVNDYWGSKGLVQSVSAGQRAAARAAAFRLRVEGQFFTMERDSWAKRSHPDEKLATVDAAYTRLVDYYGKLGDTVGRPIRTVSDYNAVRRAMKKWLNHGNLLQAVLTAEKATAKDTGLKYDPTIEYWQNISLAFDGSDVLMLDALYEQVSQDSQAGNKTKTDNDIDAISDRLATIQKTYGEWLNRPAPPHAFAKLQADFIAALKVWKPLAYDASAARSAGDWTTYFAKVKELWMDSGRANALFAEFQALSKKEHLTIVGTL